MEKTVLIIPNHQSLSFSNSTTFALTSRTSVCKWQCHKHHSLQGLRCVKLGGHICKAKTRAEGYGSTLTTKKADAEEEEEEEEEGISASELEALEQEAKSVAKEYELSVVNKLHGDKGLTLQRIKEMQRRYNRSSTDEIPDHLLPKVAILGRPNVGKSALFNRLIGRNIAIVADESGVTRDRLYCRSQWKEKAFIIVDTGGVLALPNSRGVGTDGSADAKSKWEGSFASPTKEKTSIGLTSMVEKQAITAVKDASVIIFVTDGQVGVTAADIEIADWLRKTHSDKKIILAVNKCESPRKGLLQATEFWSFGLTPIPISAIAGTGIGELLDLVCTGLRSTEEFEDKNEKEDCAAAIAIVGKPNVGKSSILNALMGEERTIVSPVSGTTRDAIDTKYNGPDGKIYRLIDTAGIRRRAAVASGGSEPESLSVNRAFRAIRRADVVALVIEAMACVTEQDYKIAERIDTEGKGCIIVINKWDTIPNKTNKTTLFYEEDVRAKLRVLSWAPIVYVSALSGSNVKKIITAANAAKNERARRLGTSVLNQVVQDSLAFKLPPMTRGGKRGRVYYCTQAAVCPPTFVFFVNDAKLFPEPYRRYMEKQLRSNIGFPGTPIRLLWRSKKKGENAPKDKEMESTNVSSEQITSPS